MNNFFTYVINLRDQMSGTLRRVGGSIVDTSNRVRRLQSDVRNLNSTPLTGLKNSFSSLFNSIPFAQYIFNPMTIAGVVAGRALKLGIDQEMRNASFEVLFGGEENARKMIDNIDAYAKKTTYGKEGLGAAVQTMAGFGMAQERIMPNLKAIGEIAMGNKGRFDSLTLAFSQMSAAGRLMGQDLLQMVNAQFNPLEQISKDTGRSLVDLKKDMEKGLISSDMVAQAFQNATKEGGRFYGMSERMGQTLGGQLSFAMANINDKLIQFYEWMQPYILPAIRGFNLLLTDTGTFIDKLVAKLEGWINNNKGLFWSISILTAAWLAYKATFLGLIGLHALIAVWRKAVIAYEIVVFAIQNATSLWTAAQWLLNMALTANPVGLIVAAVVALIALIAFLIIKVDGWGETWDNVLTMCRLGFELFKTAVTLIWLKVQDAFLTGFEVIEKGWYKVQSLWNSDAANAGLAKLEGERNARAKEIAETQGKLADLATQMSDMEVFKLRINETSFSDVANSLKSKLGISEAGVPGMPGGDGTGGGTGTGGTGGTGGGGASGKAANSISTGGSKTTHITLTIGELGNNMTVNANGIREGAQKIREIVQDEIVRGLSMAQANI